MWPLCLALPKSFEVGTHTHTRAVLLHTHTHVLCCSKPPQSCLTLCDPLDCSFQASMSMGFSRQEYWSRLPCPPPGDLPHPGIEPTSSLSSALSGRFFTTSATRKHAYMCACVQFRRRAWQPTPVFLGFPPGSDSKASACSAGDLGSIPVLGGSPGGGHGNPLQYSEAT